MLIGRVGRGGYLELDLGGAKRRTNECDVILNLYLCKILATLLFGTINFVLVLNSRVERGPWPNAPLNTLLELCGLF